MQSLAPLRARSGREHEKQLPPATCYSSSSSNPALLRARSLKDTADAQTKLVHKARDMKTEQKIDELTALTLLRSKLHELEMCIEKLDSISPDGSKNGALRNLEKARREVLAAARECAQHVVISQNLMEEVELFSQLRPDEPVTPREYNINWHGASPPGEPQQRRDQPYKRVLRPGDSLVASIVGLSAIAESREAERDTPRVRDSADPHSLRYGSAFPRRYTTVDGVLPTARSIKEATRARAVSDSGDDLRRSLSQDLAESSTMCNMDSCTQGRTACDGDAQDSSDDDEVSSAGGRYRSAGVAAASGHMPEAPVPEPKPVPVVVPPLALAVPRLPPLPPSDIGLGGGRSAAATSGSLLALPAPRRPDAPLAGSGGSDGGIREAMRKQDVALSNRQHYGPRGRPPMPPHGEALPQHAAAAAPSAAGSAHPAAVGPYPVPHGQHPGPGYHIMYPGAHPGPGYAYSLPPSGCSSLRDYPIVGRRGPGTDINVPVAGSGGGGRYTQPPSHNSIEWEDASLAETEPAHGAVQQRGGRRGGRRRGGLFGLVRNVVGFVSVSMLSGAAMMLGAAAVNTSLDEHGAGVSGVASNKRTGVNTKRMGRGGGDLIPQRALQQLRGPDLLALGRG